MVQKRTEWTQAGLGGSFGSCRRDPSWWPVVATGEQPLYNSGAGDSGCFFFRSGQQRDVTMWRQMQMQIMADHGSTLDVDDTKHFCSNDLNQAMPSRRPCRDKQCKTLAECTLLLAGSSQTFQTHPHTPHTPITQWLQRIAEVKQSNRFGGLVEQNVVRCNSRIGAASWSLMSTSLSHMQWLVARPQSAPEVVRPPCPIIQKESKHNRCLKGISHFTILNDAEWNWCGINAGERGETCAMMKYFSENTLYTLVRMIPFLADELITPECVRHDSWVCSDVVGVVSRYKGYLGLFTELPAKAGMGSTLIHCWQLPNGQGCHVATGRFLADLLTTS